MNSITKKQVKEILKYSIVCFAIFCLIYSIGLIPSFSIQITFLLILGGFTLAGLIHVLLGGKFLSLFHTSGTSGRTFLTVLLSIAGLLFLLLYARFGPAGLNPFYISGLVMFPLPMFLVVAFDLYAGIPEKIFKKWHYPLNQEPPNLDLLDLSKVLVIQFEFSKTAVKSAPTNFKAKAPAKMTLGDLFFIFINDYNEKNPNGTIQYLDHLNQPFGWLFYKRSSWLKPRFYLDADLTFEENNIQNNDILFAYREVE